MRPKVCTIRSPAHKDNLLITNINHTDSHPLYPRYSPLLSQGWIPGRLVVSTLLDFSYSFGNS